MLTNNAQHFNNNSAKFDNLADNFLRCLTMFEKVLDRLKRRNWYNESQYPQILFEIEETINSIRAWIQNYREFSFLPVYYVLLNTSVSKLTDLISQLIKTCRPLSGKKAEKKPRKERDVNTLCNNINKIMIHITQYITFPENGTSVYGACLTKGTFG